MSALFQPPSPEHVAAQRETARALGEYLVEFLGLDQALDRLVIYRTGRPDLTPYGKKLRPTTGERLSVARTAMNARGFELRERNQPKRAQALVGEWPDLAAACKAEIDLRNDVVHRPSWDEDGLMIEIVRHPSGEVVQIDADGFDAMSRAVRGVADRVRTFWYRRAIVTEDDE